MSAYLNAISEEASREELFEQVCRQVETKNSIIKAARDLVDMLNRQSASGLITRDILTQTSNLERLLNNA